MQQSTLALIRRALEEDGVDADVTTLATVPVHQQAHATIVTRQAGVIAGLAVAAAVFREVDPEIAITLEVADGTPVQPGQVVATLQGPARSLLSAERTALNFLGRLSGIATLTARCVRAIEGTQARILDTRKTTPGMRDLEKEAVRLGGGRNHRTGLHDGVLIKDNHIKAAGSIILAIEAARRTAHHLLKIEVECETLEEVREAVLAHADVILLDNMHLEVMRRAVEIIRGEAPGVLIEASGSIGTHEEKLIVVARTGVDFISLGALTHSAPNFDVSLEFE